MNNSAISRVSVKAGPWTLDSRLDCGLDCGLAWVMHLNWTGIQRVNATKATDCCLHLCYFLVT